MAVDDACLILAFNRPDHLLRLITRLREVRPSRIYLAVDGPRPDRIGEQEAVMACRRAVEEIDWTGFGLPCVAPSDDGSWCGEPAPESRIVDGLVELHVRND